MKFPSMLKPELEQRCFGSPYDPLLNGVAHGLEKLFPPVVSVRADRPGNGSGAVRPNPESATRPGSRQG